MCGGTRKKKVSLSFSKGNLQIYHFRSASTVLVYDRTLKEAQFDFSLKVCPVLCWNTRRFINKVSEWETGRLSTNFFFRQFCINRNFSRGTIFFTAIGFPLPTNQSIIQQLKIYKTSTFSKKQMKETLGMFWKERFNCQVWPPSLL